jgi:hypothetical protein
MQTADARRAIVVDMLSVLQRGSQPPAGRFGARPRCYVVPTVRELPRRWDPLTGQETVVRSGVGAPAVTRTRR